jgi:error-prone DNA polymerase
MKSYSGFTASIDSCIFFRSSSHFLLAACTLESINQNRCAVRLGLRMTRGLAEKHGLQLVAARGARPFPSILEISRRTHLPVSALVQLAKADAFRSLHLTRREASWAIKALRENTLPLFDDADRASSASVRN